MESNSQINNYKIQQLLLSRVKNLEWNYFGLDLNKAHSGFNRSISTKEIVAFFDQIEEDDLGEYVYTGEVVDEAKILSILFSIIKSYPEVFKKVLKRIFDINAIVNESESEEGHLGKFNEKDRKFRNKKFKEKIRDGFRAKKDSVVILAEGDSWFQFPRIYLRIDPVKDIIDWLIDDPKYAIHSLAAGGDWLSNIFHSGEYIEELPKVSPDVFLISGGGNDLVGNNRLAIMVINPRLEEKRSIKSDDFLHKLYEKRKGNTDLDNKKYLRGMKFISPEFYELMNLYFVQYFVFLYSLANVKKYENMLMITQGYDFAIPYNKNRGNWISLQRIVNEFTDTGTWLFEPLNMKGITNKQDQEAVIYTMIYEFNEMLIKLANFKGLPNLYHIDSRGFADEDDWYDELHLKSHAFKEIANVYKYCITQNLGKQKSKTKVYRVKSLVDASKAQ